MGVEERLYEERGSQANDFKEALLGRQPELG